VRSPRSKSFNTPRSTGLTNVKKFKINELPQSGFTVDYDANPKGYESFELYLNAVEMEENLELHCHYDIKLFEDLTIRAWLATLGSIFQDLAADPSRDVLDLARLKRADASPATEAGRPDALREFLPRKLPEYMLPSRFISLPALPLLPNSKLDRRGLPLPDLHEPHSRILKPRDEIESRLVNIWRQVLGVAEISVDDNFFDLGGHSLLATRVLSRIERVFGNKIALAELFDCPTIEQLSVRLRKARPAAPSSRVIAIQPAGSRKPFLCIGAGPMFRPLAYRLGPDQPFVGIGIDQQDLASFSVPYEMEELAARLVGIIREVQPAGPYFLGGWCLDGVFAYEVARQLQESGQQVELLALFDAPNPGAFRGASATVKIDWPQRVLAHLAVLWKLHPSKAHNYLRERMTELAAKLRCIRYRLSYRVRLTVGDGKLSDIDQLLYLLGTEYTPRPYSGRVVLFRSPVPTHDLPMDFGWRSVVPQIEIEAVPGGHRGMFEEPAVTNLAARLSSYLSSASGPEHRTERGGNMTNPQDYVWASAGLGWN
jgi:thioesterase domain-containing protein/acyl carrier protein